MDGLNEQFETESVGGARICSVAPTLLDKPATVTVAVKEYVPGAAMVLKLKLLLSVTVPDPLTVCDGELAVTPNGSPEIVCVITEFAGMFA
jgi:hypothetical protein